MEGLPWESVLKARDGGGLQLAVQLMKPAGSWHSRPTMDSAGALLVKETRAGCRSDFAFELFDFDADDFVLHFVIHCSWSFR